MCGAEDKDGLARVSLCACLRNRNTTACSTEQRGRKSPRVFMFASGPALQMSSHMSTGVPRDDSDVGGWRVSQYHGLHVEAIPTDEKT